MSWDPGWQRQVPRGMPSKKKIEDAKLYSSRRMGVQSKVAVVNRRGEEITTFENQGGTVVRVSDWDPIAASYGPIQPSDIFDITGSGSATWLEGAGLLLSGGPVEIREGADVPLLPFSEYQLPVASILCSLSDRTEADGQFVYAGYEVSETDTLCGAIIRDSGIDKGCLFTSLGGIDKLSAAVSMGSFRGTRLQPLFSAGYQISATRYVGVRYDSGVHPLYSLLLNTAGMGTPQAAHPIRHVIGVSPAGSETLELLVTRIGASVL